MLLIKAPLMIDRLQVGDLILEIEGETVATKRAKLENLISASSAIAKTWRVDTKLLSGALVMFQNQFVETLK
jgi:hypothetical protein